MLVCGRVGVQVLSVSAKVIKRKEKKKGSLDESLPSTPRGPLSLSRTNSEVKLLSRQPSLAADPASALDGKVPLPLSRQNSLARQTSLPGEPMVVEPEEPKEALFELLENPSRVTREQVCVLRERKERERDRERERERERVYVSCGGCASVHTLCVLCARCRLPLQAKVVSFPPGQRYAMVKRKLNGFVVEALTCARTCNIPLARSFLIWLLPCCSFCATARPTHPRTWCCLRPPSKQVRYTNALAALCPHL
jgi:hypothetical protein